MQRSVLARIIGAAGEIAHDPGITLIGSQTVLVRLPDSRTGHAPCPAQRPVF